MTSSLKERFSPFLTMCCLIVFTGCSAGRISPALRIVKPGDVVSSNNLQLRLPTDLPATQWQETKSEWSGDTVSSFPPHRIINVQSNSWLGYESESSLRSFNFDIDEFLYGDNLDWNAIREAQISQLKSFPKNFQDTDVSEAALHGAKCIVVRGTDPNCSSKLSPGVSFHLRKVEYRCQSNRNLRLMYRISFSEKIPTASSWSGLKDKEILRYINEVLPRSL